MIQKMMNCNYMGENFGRRLCGIAAAAFALLAVPVVSYGQDNAASGGTAMGFLVRKIQADQHLFLIVNGYNISLPTSRYQKAYAKNRKIPPNFHRPSPLCLPLAFPLNPDRIKSARLPSH